MFDSIRMVRQGFALSGMGSTGTSLSQMVTVVGRPFGKHCGVLDYVAQLGDSLGSAGVGLSTIGVPWHRQGWLRSLYRLRRALRPHKGQWCLVQYTSLMWSRRAVPLGFLPVLYVAKSAALRVGVIFHDVVPYPAQKPHHHIRRAIQERVMKAAVDVSEVAVTAVDPAVLGWIDTPSRRRKTHGIPVGSNITSRIAGDSERGRSDRARTIAVFSIDGRSQELSTLVRVVTQVSEQVPDLELKVMGRGSDEARELLGDSLPPGRVRVSVYGVQSPNELTRLLCSSDVLLSPRGVVSSRRGSAIAGIACGLPVVGYSNWETSQPIVEAGVWLAPEGDSEALAEALTEVLSNDALRSELRGRSKRAYARYFDWESITNELLSVLSYGAGAQPTRK